MDAKALPYDADLDLVREYCETGSDRAATMFVRKYQRFVFSTAYRYLGNYEDADDAAQEAFIKALSNIRSFKGKSSMKTWLYRITANICLNQKRKKKFFSIFLRDSSIALNELANNDFNPADKLESSEFEDYFTKSLLRLPEKQRETFALRYYENLSYDEISKMTGTSVGGLKANYFQAVKKLADSLDKKKELFI